jgi:acyl-CoA synthetase (NDP forming)
LLRPRSIAVLGASARPGAVGHEVLRNLRRGGYTGALYAVNPRHTEVLGVRCYPALAELPATAEHVIFAVADTRIEAALAEAIAHRARAATIFSTLLLEHDTAPVLQERIRQRALEAGLLLAGGNGMGFYNFRDGVWACGFETREHARDGNVVLLSQSGSGMSAILDCEARLAFSFAASTGQELVLGVEDYLDYVLDQPETRVVGLFLETTRKPDALRAALARATQRGIPLVALKVGRTGLAAAMALSHSGALAGSDAAWEAVFAHHGVQRVEDLDQLATALQMFAQPHPTGRGGVVTLHDSGGERSLMIDLAARAGVPLTELAPATVRTLEQILDPGLPAVNPLDAWSAGGADYHLAMQRCFAALCSDPGAALGAVVHARGPDSRIFPDYPGYLRAGHAASGKPVFLVAARQGSGCDPLALELGREGFPVIDGVAGFLAGARCLLGHRSYREAPPPALPVLDDQALARWRERLAEPRAIGEAEASVLLTAIGIPMLEQCHVDSESGLLAAAAEMDYPLVLKTAAPGIRHKSEVGGVVLGIADAAALGSAYARINERLGPEVLLAPMVDREGVEMILGVAHDAQFGPLVVMGIGGIHAELLEDVVVLLPPFDAAQARQALSRLRMRALLDGLRGAPAVDVDAFCDAAARISALAHACRDLLGEIEINPLRALPHGCIGLDALHTPAS